MNLFKSQTDKLKIFIARQYSKLIPGEKVIAVIGEHGKSTTVTAIEAVLNRKFKTISSAQIMEKPSSFYSLADISSNILKAKSSIEKIVLELPSTIDWQSKEFRNVLNPKTVVITHSRGVKDSRAEIAQFIDKTEKMLDLMEEGSQVIVNWEDQNLRTLGQNSKATCFFYGFNQANCHVWGGNVRIQNSLTFFELNYGVERVEIVTKLLGNLNINSLIGAAATGISLGLPLTTIKKGLESIEPLKGRLEMVDGHSGSIILDDSYSSDPSSWEDSLSVINQLSARRRIVVVGEMKGIVENSDRSHRTLAQRIYGERMDIVLVGGGEGNIVAEELRRLGFIDSRIESDLSNPAIVAKLLKILGRGDLVLIKGSQSNRFDEIVKKIQAKKSS